LVAGLISVDFLAVQLVLGWPVRVLLIALVIGSLFVDSAGYLYREVNHLPLSGKVDPATMPPSFSWWPFNNGNIYIHQGLDLQGGSHLELQLTDIPPGRTKSEVQATAVQVFQKRLNSFGVSEPLVQPEGQDRVVVELAGVNSARAQAILSKTAHLDFVTWVKDPNATAVGQAEAGYKPQLTGLGSSQVVSATSGLDQNGLQYAVNLTFNGDGASQFSKLTSDAVAQCPGDGVTCPTRKIAIFEDLSASDIANWSKVDPATGQTVESLVALPPEQGGRQVRPADVAQRQWQQAYGGHIVPVGVHSEFVAGAAVDVVEDVGRDAGLSDGSEVIEAYGWPDWHVVSFGSSAVMSFMMKTPRP